MTKALSRLIVLAVHTSIALCVFAGPAQAQIDTSQPSESLSQTEQEACRLINEIQNEQLEARWLTYVEELADISETVLAFESWVSTTEITRGMSDELFRCHAHNGVVWALTITEIRAEPIDEGEPEVETRVDYGVVVVDRSGNVIRSSEMHFQPGGHVISAELVFDNVQTTDLNEDGDPEIVFTVTHFTEGYNPWKTEILTVETDSIVRYQPLPDMVIERLEDWDGDGRLDLRVFPYWRNFLNCGLSGSDPESGPDFLAHALPEGAFSFNDDVAREFALSWCPGPTDMEIPHPRELNASEVRRIVCARMWGQAPETVLEPLVDRCSEYLEIRDTDAYDECDFESCMNFDRFVTMANREPVLWLAPE